MLTSLDEILLSRYVNLSTICWGLPLRVTMAFSHIKLMYSVLFEFAWRPMGLAAWPSLCSKDSDWATVFARNPSALSTSVIISAGYHLFLAFFISIKPFSFIKSIDVWSTYSRQIVFGETIWLLHDLYLPSAYEIKSTNNSVAFWLFAWTLSMIRRIVRICEVVDRFLRKLLWFFQRIFTILDLIRLRSRAL